MKITYNYKIWLEHKGKPILGKGRYMLLKSIDSTRSLKKSSKAVGICEKTAYNYIKRMEKRMGKKIIISHKGGKTGGGSTELTPTGKMLIREFERVENRLK